MRSKKTIQKLLFPFCLLASMITACSATPGATPSAVLIETVVVNPSSSITATPTPSLTPTLPGPTVPPGPDDVVIIPPKPGEQVYTDPEGWYAINFPAEMLPLQNQPGAFRWPFHTEHISFETGYLPEFGYVSEASSVCAWLANAEFEPAKSDISFPYEPIDESLRHANANACIVSTQLTDRNQVRVEIFENPGEAVSRRFAYIKTNWSDEKYRVQPTFYWLKTRQKTRPATTFEPLQPEEVAEWEKSAPTLQNITIKEMGKICTYITKYNHQRICDFRRSLAKRQPI